MTNGERIITIPPADPIHAYTMAGILKYAGITAVWPFCDYRTGPTQKTCPAFSRR